MQRALPWLIAAAASGVAVWSWTANRENVVAPAIEAKTAGTEPALDDVTPLRTTQACLARLELAQAALDRCERAEGRREDAEEPACMAEPEVVAAVERRIATAIEAHVERERSREGRARAHMHEAFDEWSTQSLGILPHEREWLVQYVCAARELRDRTLEALDELPPEQALEQLADQRKQILEDLEQALGPDRYATLRTIGGIGLLADSTDCSAPAAG